MLGCLLRSDRICNFCQSLLDFCSRTQEHFWWLRLRKEASNKSRRCPAHQVRDRQRRQRRRRHWSRNWALRLSLKTLRSMNSTRRWVQIDCSRHEVHRVRSLLVGESNRKAWLGSNSWTANQSSSSSWCHLFQPQSIRSMQMTSGSRIPPLLSSFRCCKSIHPCRSKNSPNTIDV